MIITFVNGKGGVGKTTLSVMMALLYHELGKKTALLDNDPQKTASKWLDEIRENYKEACPPLAVPGESYDIVVIDTPPRLDSEEVVGAIKLANTVILLSSPSPADLWTTRETVKVVNSHIRPGSKGALLFNQVVGHTKLGREVETISEQIGMAALKNVIPRSQSFQHAAIYGLPALTANSRDALQRVALEIATM